MKDIAHTILCILVGLGALATVILSVAFIMLPILIFASFTSWSLTSAVVATIIGGVLVYFLGMCLLGD
jgi:hypothetical protein